MKIFIDYDKFEATFKQLETIFKQDKSAKTENRVVICHIPTLDNSREVDLPLFLKTKSVQVCQPLHIVEGYNELVKNIELNIPEIIGILNSFRKEEHKPNKVVIDYSEGDRDISLSIFVPQGDDKLDLDPLVFYFSIRDITPPLAVMNEFLSDIQNPDISYQPTLVKGVIPALETFTEGYKHIPSHITSQVYVRFSKKYIYMRTAVGMIAYVNKFQILQNVNLMEDSLKILTILTKSFETLNIWVNEKNAKVYIQTGVGGGTFILNYRTRYNEDRILPEIFSLTSSKETIVLNRGAFERNLARVEPKSSFYYYTRPRGNGEILCDIGSRVMQSLIIVKRVGDLVNSFALKLNKETLSSALVPLVSSDTGVLNMHFGTKDKKTVTIGFTDDTGDWYSLISVQGIFDDELKELKAEHEKYKF